MLTLVRGLPGSGKSTLAKFLAVQSDSTHFEADMYFMKDGVYQFDGNKIHLAHAWCQDSTREALARGRYVIVSNTFTTLKEMKFYFELSYELLGVPPVVYLAQNNFKNVHDVPEEVLDKMRKRFVYDLTPLYETDLPSGKN